MSDNEKKIEDWRRLKPVLFGGRFTDKREVRDAVLGYLLRSLSRGRIPDVVLTMETLEEKRPVPACGYINCFLEVGDHVH